jgi:site-specific DNA-methyltransferase (adenine-specific)
MVARGERVDAVCTDPPYEIGFMSKSWDQRGIAFNPATWRLCFELLPPGGHLLAFGSSRTHHRMFCAVEDAGFEIRDTIVWMYSTGYPKSRNLGNGWGTALKPAAEFIVLARKPLIGTVAENVQAHGTGALNIDGCRIEASDDYTENAVTQGINTAQTSYAPAVARRTFVPAQAGRWPANVIHDGSDEVLAAFAAYTSERTSKPSASGPNSKASIFSGGNGEQFVQYADTGTAARFFYSAKADSADRLGSRHPTVKPVDLKAYLCRLVTPPKGTVLDPFAGSGSTGMACLREGFECILIEKEAEHVADCRRRLAHVRGEDAPLFTGEMT